LNYAVGVGKLKSVPQFPSVKVTSKPRGSYNLAEYLTLVRVARRFRGQSVPEEFTGKSRRGQKTLDQFARVSEDLHWLIRFMVNGFMRPSDIKFLQHKHVTVVRGRHTYLRLNLPETKKHDKPIVTLQPAVVVYERMLAWQVRNGFGSLDDYVFLPDHPNRNLVLEAYRWQFNFIQQKANIGSNTANGQHRTLYSLRHSAMTFRLLYGRKVDLLTLAKNARTSVEMVERFYSSNLDAEMNIDLLHGKR
jgi:integrase